MSPAILKIDTSTIYPYSVQVEHNRHIHESNSISKLFSSVNMAEDVQKYPNELLLPEGKKKERLQGQ